MRRASMMVSIMAVAALGCTDADSPLLILQNQVPGDGCSLTASASGNSLGGGVIDVNSPQGYIFNPVIRNITDAPRGNANGTRIAFIEGYEVDISFPGAGSCSADASLTSFSRPVGATIGPNNGTGALSVEIVPQEFLAGCNVSGDARIDLTAEVTFFGTMDGGDIESNTFPYPIQVCDGCTLTNLGLCTEIAGLTIEEGGACNPFQDFELSCCEHSSGNLVCPAIEEEPVP